MQWRYDNATFNLLIRTSADTNMDDNVANISFIVVIETDLFLRGSVLTAHRTISLCVWYKNEKFSL